MVLRLASGRQSAGLCVTASGCCDLLAVLRSRAVAAITAGRNATYDLVFGPRPPRGGPALKNARNTPVSMVRALPTMT